MPYSKAHKEKTRNSILSSARKLFSAEGYDAITVNDIMQDCKMTRGGFYAHFKSKAELYREALKYSAVHSELAKTKPAEMPSREWLDYLLDAYLSLEHVKGSVPCPLAFLATDIATKDHATKKTYAQIYKIMNKIIIEHANQNQTCSEEDIYALTSMMIGAVAISRTIEDTQLINTLLSSCRAKAQQILDGA